MPLARGPRPSIAPPDIVADCLIDAVYHQKVILYFSKKGSRLPVPPTTYSHPQCLMRFGHQAKWAVLGA